VAEEPSESQRRLRAALRSLLSHGVWLTIVFELCVSTLPRTGALEQLGAGKFAILGVVAAIAVYLQAGTMLALARGREVISVTEVLLSGRLVFPRFVWLMLKIGLLFLVLINVALLGLSAAGLIDIEDKDALPVFASIVAVAIVPLKYLLAYWLPWVFAHQDFRLSVSLPAALRMGWRRFPQAGWFLALLLLLPGSVLVSLSPQAPVVLLTGIMLVAMQLDWIAYVYCVETVREEPPGAPGR
jgi:hypothetical protein